MSRYVPGLCAVISLIFGSFSLTGCGGSGSSSGTPTPTSVNISPSGNSVSVELGNVIQFTGSPLDPNHRPLGGVPVSYVSSNSSVLTFTPTAPGLACAGSWNATAQVCTAGSIGTTQVTAVANGVSSPAVTVYVHDHVDRIQISEFFPIYPPPPPAPCVTSVSTPGVQNFRDYQAHAFSNGIDITNSIGSFTFQQVIGSVVTLNTTASELNNNNGSQVTQVRATAGRPGITQIYASAAGVTSAPLPFETCLIETINLQVGDAATNTTFSTSKGGGLVTITPVVLDRDNPPRQLTTAQATPLLTWSSLAPSNATVSSAGAVTARAVGGTSITASCLAPSCNVGSTNGQPPNQQPVYPSNVITGTITGNPGTGTVFVTSTCNIGGQVIEGCQPAVLPVNSNSNLIGNRTVLPSAPNSFVFNPQGTKGFLGSTRGLMVFTPSQTNATVTQFNGAPGVVLAVSNDGNKVVVADTNDTPNQVFILDSSSGAITPLLITGATAAAFSPDGFKLFIAAGTNTLYVYSNTAALTSVCLTSTSAPPCPPGVPVQSISFYANGALAYINGGAPNAISVYNVCDNSLAETIPVPRQPTFFQAALDGQHAIGIDSPNVDVLIPPPPSPSNPQGIPLIPPASGTCPFGFNTPPPTFINLGQANFTPLKMIVTPDSGRAYVFASDRSSVLIYNFGVNTVTAIPLTGSPAPVAASLSSDGSQLYVGGSDGALHALSTISGVDLQEITFPPNNNTNNDALCTNVPSPCLPDLVAFQP